MSGIKRGGFCRAPNPDVPDIFNGFGTFNLFDVIKSFLRSNELTILPNPVQFFLG